MGYMSDVKYVLMFPTEETYTAFMGEVQLRLGDNPAMQNIIHALQNKQVRTSTKAFDGDYDIRVDVAWDFVKWYDDTNWVQEQRSLITLAEEDYSGAWFFTRLGEEEDDYEKAMHCPLEYYDLWDVISLNRSTSFCC